jgi:hypothetical protein
MPNLICPTLANRGVQPFAVDRVGNPEHKGDHKDRLGSAERLAKRACNGERDQERDQKR